MPKVYREQEIEDLVAKLVDARLRHAQFLNDTVTQSGTNALVDGGSLATADSGPRVEITSGLAERVLFYTGDTAETAFGQLSVDISGAGPTRVGELTLASPNLGTGTSTLFFRGGSVDGTTEPLVWLQAPSGSISLDATTTGVTGSLVDPAGHPYPRWVGPVQRTISGGEVTDTTSGVTAQMNVPHGLGVAPIAYSVIHKGTVQRQIDVVSVGTTNIVIQVSDPATNNLVTSTAVTVAFTAIG